MEQRITELLAAGLEPAAIAELLDVGIDVVTSVGLDEVATVTDAAVSVISDIFGF